MQLLYLLEAVEKELPGIEIHIACKPQLSYLRDHFKSGNRLITGKELDTLKNDFSYVRELKCDLQHHPVEALLNESDLNLSSLLPPEPQSPTRKCIICGSSLPPTKNLPSIDHLVKKAIKEGYEPTTEQKIEGAGWVIGVESEILFLAAAKGIRTTLIPTGVGTELYHRLFPKNEILADI